jgi:hypothetical protein
VDLCLKKNEAMHRIVVSFWGAKPPEDHGPTSLKMNDFR